MKKTILLLTVMLAALSGCASKGYDDVITSIPSSGYKSEIEAYKMQEAEMNKPNPSLWSDVGSSGTIFLDYKANSEYEINELTDKYLSEQTVEEECEKTKTKWRDLLNVITVKTPVESLNILMNGWLVYQTLTSRILGKTGYYQSGGAYGFRDQLQDCLGIKYIDSKFLKEQIINCARHQFVEGDVLHWWHNETKRGIRTKFSDDYLWLVYGTIEYVKFENDYSILDENIEYLSGEVLKENEDEKYNLYHGSNIKESLFEHCIKSIENAINKGIDPFPKIGVGDWNDGFSNIGPKGKGESIWLGFFLYDILNKFVQI